MIWHNQVRFWFIRILFGYDKFRQVLLTICITYMLLISTIRVCDLCQTEERTILNVSLLLSRGCWWNSQPLNGDGMMLILVASLGVGVAVFYYVIFVSKVTTFLIYCSGCTSLTSCTKYSAGAVWVPSTLLWQLKWSSDSLSCSRPARCSIQESSPGRVQKWILSPGVGISMICP